MRSCLVAVAVVALTLQAARLRAETGIVELGLTGGYQLGSSTQWQHHSGELGALMQVGVNRRAALQLATRFSQIVLSDPPDDLPAQSRQALTVAAGASVLVDYLPQIDPLLLVELVGAYGPGVAPPPGAVERQVQLGAGVGLGLRYHLGDSWVVGVALRHRQLGPIDRLWAADQLVSQTLVELQLGLRLVPRG